MEKHPLHIKIPELQKSEEVSVAVEKQERLSGEKLPNDPTVRIEAYTDRLENVFLNPDKRVRERNIEMLRPAIYDKLIIKPEQVPESYFELQQQVARERGQEVETIPPDVRKQMIETVIKDQEHSLNQWMEYLSSDDAVYPAWFKYFVWKNITKLSQFDKSLGKFKDRTPSTVAPYPDVYREPLAQICDIYEQVAKDNKKLKTDPEIQRQFSQSFPKLYAELITKSLASSVEGREEIRGEWIKYTQGNERDAERLFKSLEGKGTGWCTAGRSTAETQIESGDFYVYYTYDKSGMPTQPRVAIRMEGKERIGEVRGVLQHQSLEPQMNDILEAKLSEFGSEADRYKKKSEDMRRMTEIEKKTKESSPLTKNDLVFLYEIEAPIEGFGYQKDPRIEEVREQRDLGKDLPIIFECSEMEIAFEPKHINEKTKVYIGEWNIEIFKKIKQFPDIKHLYKDFPGEKIFMQTLETDPEVNSPKKAEAKLKEQNIYLSDWGKDILYKTEFSKKQEKYELVRFTVAELGFTESAITDQIYKRAGELGLELCPAEVGLHLRLSYLGGEWMLIAMKQIVDRDGDPSVFHLGADGAGLKLGGDVARSVKGWNPSDQFVFLSRKDT